MLTASTVVSQFNALNDFLPVSSVLAIFLGSALLSYVIYRAKSMFGRVR